MQRHLLLQSLALRIPTFQHQDENLTMMSLDKIFQSSNRIKIRLRILLLVWEVILLPRNDYQERVNMSIFKELPDDDTKRKSNWGKCERMKWGIEERWLKSRLLKMRNDLTSNNRILTTSLIDKIKPNLKIATKTESIKWSMRKRNDFTQQPIVQHVNKDHTIMSSNKLKKLRLYPLKDNRCMEHENLPKNEIFHLCKNGLTKLQAIII